MSKKAPGKTQNKCEFLAFTRHPEKVAVFPVDMKQEGHNVILAIDFFTK